MDYYLQLRRSIHTKLNTLKTKYGISQAKIAKYVSVPPDFNVWAKDINALNNLQNKTKWRGETKIGKLEAVLAGLRELEKEQKKFFEQPDVDEETKILAIVENAIKAEFYAYQNLPKIESTQKIIEQYFSPNGSAKKRIQGILKRNNKRNWTLTNELNPSTSNLIEAELIELSSDKAVVMTKEYWLLVWFNTLSKEIDYIYEKEGQQKYILVKNKDSGLFQIDVNSYEAIDKRVLPNVFNDDAFDDVMQKDSEEIAKTLRQVISIGGLEAALNILKQYTLQTGLNDIAIESSRIESILNEHIRWLNTEKISKEEYFSKKAELIASTLKLVMKFESNHSN